MRGGRLRRKRHFRSRGQDRVIAIVCRPLSRPLIVQCIDPQNEIKMGCSRKNMFSKWAVDEMRSRNSCVTSLGPLTPSVHITLLRVMRHCFFHTVRKSIMRKKIQVRSNRDCFCRISSDNCRSIIFTGDWLLDFTAEFSNRICPARFRRNSEISFLRTNRLPNRYYSKRSSSFVDPFVRVLSYQSCVQRGVKIIELSKIFLKKKTLVPTVQFGAIGG